MAMTKKLLICDKPKVYKLSAIEKISMQNFNDSIELKHLIVNAKKSVIDRGSSYASLRFYIDPFTGVWKFIINEKG